jgi:hypothetical protein
MKVIFHRYGLKRSKIVSDRGSGGGDSVGFLSLRSCEGGHSPVGLWREFLCGLVGGQGSQNGDDEQRDVIWKSR